MWGLGAGYAVIWAFAGIAINKVGLCPLCSLLD